MATLYFICGFIGSGKTTYSKQLSVDEKAFRFSIDEWMIPLYGEHMEREVFDTRLTTLQSLFKESAKQMLDLNVSVIFDFGFWRQIDRNEMIAWANQYGYKFELHYLDTPYDVCINRAMKRNTDSSSESYDMTPDMLQLFWSWFEIPTSNEQVKRIV
ncbi:ATP-binding protein [Vibrio sp.]|nr:ATP-binding protein [Vibrio sp.]